MMHPILLNTHKAENIRLLKARDYYFDKARYLTYLERALACLPPVALALSYLPRFDRIIGDNRDVLTGVIAIVAVLFGIKLKRDIECNKRISNTFREKYDCNVLGIEENQFAYNDINLDEYIDKADRVKDYYKYEVWYGEIYNTEKWRNAICCQMDNIIYTYHVYAEYRKILYLVPILTLSSLSAIYFYYGGAVFVLSLISLFQILQMFYEAYINLNEAIVINKQLKDQVMHEDFEKKLEDNNVFLLRALQDIVIFNRNNSLFIPKYIRDKYLVEGNPFYQELDSVKKKYMDHQDELKSQDVIMPQSAEDLEILSLDGKSTVKLRQIQDRLLRMMVQVHQVFEEENIPYTLDGGTLIGAVRNKNYVPRCSSNQKPDNYAEALDYENGNFIFWDDDIDIAIPYPYLERAKAVIRARFSDIWDVQDYENDSFYSPRLSNFRIREKSHLSRITEKDSPLYSEYNYRGIFIDVYSYSPVLVNRLIDKIYRYFLIHPLNRRLSSIESAYSTSTNKKEIKNIFLQLKEKYLARVQWYIDHAKNEAYYCYTPTYIDNPKKTGPYIRNEALYGEKRSARFASASFSIPSIPEEVLEAYYGKWYESPYVPKEKLKKDYPENWFSNNKFLVSVLKHLEYVDLYDDDGQRICAQRLSAYQ